MSHLLKLAVIGACFGAIAAPSIAADYNFPGDIRGSYGADWANDDMQAISFDIGARYWYSLGDHQMVDGVDTYSATDTSHILEGFARINDHVNNAFLDGTLGYAAATFGSYSTPSGSGTSSLSKVMYAGTDFGVMPWTWGSLAVGGFVGYKYMNESVNQGFAGQAMNINTLRAGFTGKMDMGAVDFDFKAAAVPYSWLTGEYASFNAGAGGGITGALFGGEAEAFIGWHPTDMMAVRLGARGSYLTGPADVGAGPTVTDSLHFMRVGVLGEVSAHF